MASTPNVSPSGAPNVNWHFWTVAVALIIGLVIGASGARLLPQSSSHRQRTPASEGKPARQLLTPEDQAKRKKEQQEFQNEMEKLRKTNPAEYQKAKSGFVLMAQMVLGQFGYGTVFNATLDERAQKAIREYQAYNGLAVTGDIDANTIDQMNADRKIVDEPASAFLPPLQLLINSWDDGWISASGSWIERGRSNETLSTSEIQCYKQHRLCVEAKAEEGVKISGISGGFSVVVVPYDVERWDRYEIVTKTVEWPCGRENIHINRQEKSVTAISIPAYKDEKNCHTVFGPPKSSTYDLADGARILELKSQARQTALRRILRVAEEAKSTTGIFEQESLLGWKWRHP